MCFIMFKCYRKKKEMRSWDLWDLPLGPFCLSHLAASECPFHQNISAFPAIQKTQWLSWVRLRKKEKKDRSAKSSFRTYWWQGLIHINRIQAPRAQALLSLLFLILFHGLFYANLGSAPYTFFKWLQLIVKGILVLLICCLWEGKYC